ncbi:class I SAM-dependent methyltransferase [Evansella sp. AB-P1]|uniref:class I SAM-dependent methyltransferase n=1 Tax=Evansella sp. AB-P1 TaxID=3037653 RepID=UPI00241E0D28|nr:class I SAM-dependent methyltransferase [Evansella sp. AB-P1]MDG5789514.1 class I SAM-dependent methyltransferase [Evansella sp. AB-P1]
MGLEFIDLFDRWAQSYDTTVEGMDEEYREVFVNYRSILQEVANRVEGNILEFGSGTGNLTQLLLIKAKHVVAIEPSEKMREAARKKLPDATILPGDFLQFSIPENEIDAIISSYAFHHLTNKEKFKAIKKYSHLLKSGGKIVFADTMFKNEAEKNDMIEKAKDNQFFNLAEDLQTEYYPTIATMKSLFEAGGFDASFHSMNSFVWIVEARKRS